MSHQTPSEYLRQGIVASFLPVASKKVALLGAWAPLGNRPPTQKAPQYGAKEGVQVME